MTLTSHRPRATLIITITGAAIIGIAIPVAALASTSAGAAGLSNSQLTQMREEERVARDLYTQLATSSGSVLFTRIAAAEQRHLDAVERLMTTQGINPDAAGNAVGTYAFADLQADYTKWLSQGRTSADAAYKVGIDVEKQDIADLRKLHPASGTDAARVVSALLVGSQHHLAAFTKTVNGDPTGLGYGMGGMAGRGNGGMSGAGDAACPFADDDVSRGPQGPGMQGRGRGASQSS